MEQFFIAEIKVEIDSLRNFEIFRGYSVTFSFLWYYFPLWV